MSESTVDIDPSVDQVLERIAAGAPLRAACQGAGLSPWGLLKRIERGDAELGQRYARAREMQALCDAEKIDDSASELLALARSGQPVDNGTVQAYARAIDALKWAAARKHPKVYGDRLDVHESRDVQVTISLGASPSQPETKTLDVVAQTMPLLSAPAAPTEGDPTPKRKPRRKRGPQGG